MAKQAHLVSPFPALILDGSEHRVISLLRNSSPLTSTSLARVSEMSMEDFLANFDYLDICHVLESPSNEHTTSGSNTLSLANHTSGGPENKITRAFPSFFGRWVRGVTAGGRPFVRASHWANPQYVVRIPTPDMGDPEGLAALVVALLQADSRPLRHRAPQLLSIGFVLYRLPPGANPPMTRHFFETNNHVASVDFFYDSREVVKRFRLVPGIYLLIPCTYAADKPGEFLLRVLFEQADRTLENLSDRNSWLLVPTKIATLLQSQEGDEMGEETFIRRDKMAECTVPSHGTAISFYRTTLGDPLLPHTTRHLLNALLSHNPCHLKMSKGTELAIPLQTPAFDPRNSESWFKQFEMVIRLRGATKRTIWFQHLVPILPTAIVTQFAELTSMPPDNDSYDRLKQAIISRLSVPREKRLDQLFAKFELGDRTSSQLLHHMRSLAIGSPVADEILKKLWMKCLPKSLIPSLVTSPSRDNLDKLAEEADLIYDPQDGTVINSWLLVPTKVATLLQSQERDKMGEETFIRRDKMAECTVRV
nr:gag pol polyprotein [Hymenolepis microstoma]